IENHTYVVHVHHCCQQPHPLAAQCIIVPLLMVTPLAITWSVLALFCFALNVQVEVASVLKVSALRMVSVACTVVPAAGARNAPVPLPVPTVTAPEIFPFPPKVPAVTRTGPVPVAE